MKAIKYMLAATVVAAALASSSVFASLEFKFGDATLCLSEKNGAVESLVACGVERVVPAAEAFTLQLLDGKGNSTRRGCSGRALRQARRPDSDRRKTLLK